MGPMVVPLVFIGVYIWVWYVIAKRMAHRHLVIRHVAGAFGGWLAAGVALVAMYVVLPRNLFDSSEDHGRSAANQEKKVAVVTESAPPKEASTAPEVALTTGNEPLPAALPPAQAPSTASGKKPWQPQTYRPGPDAPPWMANVVLTQSLAVSMGHIDATDAGRGWPLKLRELQVSCSRSGVIVMDDEGGRSHAVGMPHLKFVEGGIPVRSMDALFRSGQRSAEAEAALAELAQPLCDYRKNPLRSAILTPERLGAEWPFVVDQVVLHCIAPQGVYGFAGGKLYGLNNPPAERMRANNAQSPDEILVEPDNLMLRMPVIQAGLALCG